LRQSKLKSQNKMSETFWINAKGKGLVDVFAVNHFVLQYNKISCATDFPGVRALLYYTRHLHSRLINYYYLYRGDGIRYTASVYGIRRRYTVATRRGFDQAINTIIMIIIIYVGIRYLQPARSDQSTNFYFCMFLKH